MTSTPAQDLDGHIGDQIPAHEPALAQVPPPDQNTGEPVPLRHILRNYPELTRVAQNDLGENGRELQQLLVSSPDEVQGQLGRIFGFLEIVIGGHAQESNGLLREVVDLQRQVANISRQKQEAETALNTCRNTHTPTTTTPPTPGPGPATFDSPTPLQHQPASVSVAQRPRASEPPLFDESENDPALRQAEYTNWRSLIRIKLSLDRLIFPSPSDRILYTCSRLGGAAYARVRSRVETVAANPQQDPTISQWPEGWTDYDAVIRTLDTSYIVVDVYSLAVRLFEKFRQDNLPFSNFLSRFLQLADESRRSKEQMVEALKSKVNNKLQNALVGVTNRPVIEDVEGWINLLRELSNNIADKEFRLHDHTYSAPHQRQTNTVPPAPRRPQEDRGDPMQLDRVATTTGPRPRLTQAEKEKRYRDGCCMYCGEKGHFVHNCPSRPKGPGQNGANTASTPVQATPKND